MIRVFSSNKRTQWNSYPAYKEPQLDASGNMPLGMMPRLDMVLQLLLMCGCLFVAAQSSAVGLLSDFPLMRCSYLLILRVNQWLSWYKSAIFAPRLTFHLGKFRICDDWEADNLREDREYFLVRPSFRPSRGDISCMPSLLCARYTAG